MKFPSLLKTVAITGLAVVTLVGGHLPAVAADANYILNTASTGGTYHPVGTAIATLTKIKSVSYTHLTLPTIYSV